MNSYALGGLAGLGQGLATIGEIELKDRNERLRMKLAADLQSQRDDKEYGRQIGLLEKREGYDTAREGRQNQFQLDRDKQSDADARARIELENKYRQQLIDYADTKTRAQLNDAKEANKAIPYWLNEDGELKADPPGGKYTLPDVYLENGKYTPGKSTGMTEQSKAMLDDLQKQREQLSKFLETETDKNKRAAATTKLDDIDIQIKQILLPKSPGGKVISTLAPEEAAKGRRLTAKELNNITSKIKLKDIPRISDELKTSSRFTEEQKSQINKELERIGGIYKKTVQELSSLFMTSEEALQDYKRKAPQAANDIHAPGGSDIYQRQHLVNQPQPFDNKFLGLLDPRRFQ